MRTNEKILKFIIDNKKVTGNKLRSQFGISRQAINKHIKKLINDFKIVKKGTTKDAVYIPATKSTAISSILSLDRTYFIKNLEEDVVFNQFAGQLKLKSIVNLNAYNIISYIFTEILNNAIDHSKSDRCKINIHISTYEVQIEIRDYGIGLYYSIYSKYGLKNEEDAVGELLKGKTTTMKSKHSGEGIFFTSKAADYVSFRSHKIKLIFDNNKNDVFIENCRQIKGTDVTLKINRSTKKNLKLIFDEYSPGEYNYKFERTKVLIRFFQDDYISRSEARRLLNGLNKFKEIILDFSGVKTIGQGFADEIFRVFKNKNPAIIIKTTNLSSQLKTMLNHVVDNNKNI
jgi:anti-sigma regulatory factor (Ser/Thr protein kinase)